MDKTAYIIFFAAVILQCTVAKKDRKRIFPGRGCGTLNEIKYLKKLPEDTSGLSCAIYDPDAPWAKELCGKETHFFGHVGKSFPHICFLCVYIQLRVM